MARRTARPAPSRLSARLPAGPRGSFVEGVYTGAEGTRPEWIYVPAGHDGSRVLPLLVMLHGCAQDPLDLARGSRANGVADELGFFVLYPQQTPEDHPRRCWRWYLPEHQERGRGEPALLSAMTRRVAERYAIDPQRIYVAGMSAGAAMASVLGAAYPDLYAALGIHSGLAYRAAHGFFAALSAQQRGGPHPASQGEIAFAAMGPRARPLPVIIFHGREDTLVRVVNSHHVLEQWSEANARAAGIGRLVGETVVGRSSDGRAFERTLHRDEQGRILLEQWIVEELGHAWSGGSPDGSFTDPRGPDATREMARFLLSHRKELP